MSWSLTPHVQLTVISWQVVTDEFSRNKGYGFLLFESEEVAQEVIAKSKVIFIDGAPLETSKFVTRAQREASALENLTNLFVKNIPDHFEQEDLRGLFSSYGTITSCVIMKDAATGASRGFGFVNFSQQAEAERVCSFSSRLVNFSVVVGCDD